MQPLNQFDTSTKPVIMAAWAETLTESAKHTLDHMSHTLTLAEAKVALVRELMAQRHARTERE